jgi:phosphoglucomutase
VTQIKFGTSGWRGILAEDFTFENVKIVTQAIADSLRSQGLGDGGVVIGYDARFMGYRFAGETARVLAGAGIKAFLCDRDTPTPVIAHEILRRKADGGINFTASHNPYDYNGLKFSPAWGGPALPETTRDIEARANAMLGEICYRELSLEAGRSKGLIEDIDPCDEYCATLRKIIDLPAIGRAGLRIAVNPMYGTGRGYLDRLLREAGVDSVVINDHTDPYFGGLPPEPAEANIEDFIALVKCDPKINLGVATDGDADRYGILDADGSYIEPNYILALLADFLVRYKGESGAVARSVATSHFLDAVARHHQLEVLETPVGFKFIGEYIRDDKIAIGGEESAGLTVRGHVPDKDGILACLLVAEMVAVTGKTLKELLADLYSRVGEFHTRRINLRLTSGLKGSNGGKDALLPEQFGGLKVLERITIDGNKFLLENDAWVLFRKSGTEPVVRVYGEARDAATLERVLLAAKEYVLA